MYSKILAVLLAGAMVLPAQQPSPGAATSAAEPGAGLKVIVVEGEGATNQIRSRSGVAPVVEVRDENDKPVPGAEVYFQLPLAGPSGYFNGWLRNQTVKTDANGRAAARGFQPNDEEGRFNIKATATMGSRSGSAVIAQSNVRTGGSSSPSRMSSSSNKKWWIVAAVGAAALTGGVVAATRDGNGSSTSSAPRAITITPGAVTVGGPR